MCIVDRIFTRIGASDNLIQGKSTFMIEMNEIANILKYATNQSLLIIDELGRGTSTKDGISIAKAVIQYIHEHIKAKTLFATHYHELKELETKGITNYHLEVSEENNTIEFLRKLKKGGTDNSYGIYVAKLAGIPQEVIDLANNYLNSSPKKDIDINNITPIQALMILSDLKKEGLI